MAFPDKFNAWYNTSVADNEPNIFWQEPVQGSRYRWKKDLVKNLAVWSLFGAFFLLPLPRKHQGVTAPFDERLGDALMVMGLIAALSWAFSFTKTRIILTPTLVIVGSGRSRTRFKWHSSVPPLREELNGYQTLVFVKDGAEKLRVFLPPEDEAEILRFIVSPGAEQAG